VADGERRHQALFHLDALTLVGLPAFDLEEVLVSVLSADVEVDARRGTYSLAEVPEELLPLIERIWLGFFTLELADALGDELTREDRDRTREIKWLLHFRVNFFSDGGGDALVQIPEASREAALAQERYAGYESIMEWRQESSRRNSLACNLLKFACRDGVSDPPFHEARE
jgi:hypothetical protein